MIIYSIIVADWLGAEQYGYIAAAYAATSISAFLFNWGFNQYLMTRGSTTTQPELLGGRVIFIKGFLGAIWGFFLFFVLRYIRPDIYLSYILILTISEVWLDSLFGTLIAIIILQGRAGLASVLLVSSRLIRLLLLFVLILFGTNSIFLVLILRLATTAISFIVIWILTKPAFSGVTWQNIRKLFSQSSAFNSSELLSLIFISIDVNILVWLGASSETIANYSIVMSLINAVVTLPSGIFNVVLPSLVRSFKQNRPLFIKRIRIVYISFFILAIGLWTGATYLSQPFITAILGDSYSESVQLLIWLSPLLGLRTINQSNIAYLLSVGWQSKRILPQIIALIFKMGFGLYAVHKFQNQGIIIVAIIAELLLVILFSAQVVRHNSSRIKPNNNENFDDIL
jgi:O-antigen/teichoic acid export membrane protein